MPRTLAEPSKARASVAEWANHHIGLDRCRAAPGTKFRPNKRNAPEFKAPERSHVKGGDAFVTPFRLRYKRFSMQMPGEILFLLAKLVLVWLTLH